MCTSHGWLNQHSRVVPADTCYHIKITSYAPAKTSQSKTNNVGDWSCSHDGRTERASKAVLPDRLVWKYVFACKLTIECNKLLREANSTTQGITQQKVVLMAAGKRVCRSACLNSSVSSRLPGCYAAILPNHCTLKICHARKQVDLQVPIVPF